MLHTQVLCPFLLCLFIVHEYVLYLHLNGHAARKRARLSLACTYLCQTNFYACFIYVRDQKEGLTQDKKGISLYDANARMLEGDKEIRIKKWIDIASIHLPAMEYDCDSHAHMCSWVRRHKYLEPNADTWLK